MPKFPDKLSLGDPGSLRSGRHIVQASDVDASAQYAGMKKIGAAIAGLGGMLSEREEKATAEQNALDLLKAEAEHTRGLTDLDRKLENDPDYGSHDTKFVAGAGDVTKKAAGVIRDPKMREKWALRATVENETKRGGVLNRSDALQREERKGVLQETLNGYATRYSDPTATPEERMQARRAIDEAITLGGRSGLLNPKEQRGLKQEFIRGLELDDIKRRMIDEPEVLLRDLETSGADRRAPGMLQPGTIDLTRRPVVKNADGTISTLRSMSVGIDGKEVLVPTIAPDGRELNEEEAIAQYEKTGQHLGVFDTPEAATSYAKTLSDRIGKKAGSAAKALITAQLETGQADPLAGVGQIANDSAGSKSYGNFGLNTNGSMQEFAKDYLGETITAAPGSKEFDAQWKSLAQADPQFLHQLEMQWFEEKILPRISTELTENGVPAEVASDPRVQAYFADRMVQYGPNSNKSYSQRIKRAIEASGLVETKKPTAFTDYARGKGVKAASTASDEFRASTGAAVSVYDDKELGIINKIDDKAGYGRAATRQAKPFQGIVVHHTGGDKGVEDMVKYGHTTDPERGGSFGYHFYIDRDGTIYQAAPMDRRTNHIKDPEHRRRKDGGDLSNANSIGISLVAPGSGKETPEQIDAAQRLAHSLARNYNIDVSKIVGHGDLQTDREAGEGSAVTKLLRGGAAPEAGEGGGPLDPTRFLRTMSEADAANVETDFRTAIGTVPRGDKQRERYLTGLGNRITGRERLSIGSLESEQPGGMYPHLSPLERSQFISQTREGLRKRTDSMRSEFKQLIESDIESLRRTGSGVEFDLDLATRILEPSQISKWRVERAEAQYEHEALSDIDNLTVPQIEQRLLDLQPKSGDPQFDVKQKVYDLAEKQLKDIRELRTDDPARAVIADPGVQQAQQAANGAPGDPEAQQALVRARLDAQARVGVAKGLQSPVTVQEARTMAAKIRGLSGEPLSQAMNDLQGELQTTYGPYAHSVGVAIQETITRDRDLAERVQGMLRRVYEGKPPTAAQIRETEILNEGQIAMRALGIGGEYTMPHTQMGVGRSPDDLERGTVQGGPLNTFYGFHGMAQPPLRARADLQRNPGLASQFEAKYGRGSAAAALATPITEDEIKALQGK